MPSSHDNELKQNVLVPISIGKDCNLQIYSMEQLYINIYCSFNFVGAYWCNICLDFCYGNFPSSTLLETYSKS
jgi:hypothetical protein